MSTFINKQLLSTLVCPVTKQSLNVLSADKLAAINEAITSGDVQQQNGVQVEQSLQAAVITQNEEIIYRVDDQIPVMLEPESILMTQFS